MHGAAIKTVKATDLLKDRGVHIFEYFEVLKYYAVSTAK
jgi:hypothetical protein